MNRAIHYSCNVITRYFYTEAHLNELLCVIIVGENMPGSPEQVGKPVLFQPAASGGRRARARSARQPSF